MEAAGSGGTTELLAWISALPFTVWPAEVLGYAPTLAWRTRTGMVAWPRVARSHADGAPGPRPPPNTPAVEQIAPTPNDRHS